MPCICDPIEKDGHKYNQWIGSVFSDCVYTAQDTAAFFIGMSSIVIWMFCQTPQLYENYKRGSVESLSKVFLSIWLVGDLTNLSGSVLTKQLPTQQYTAMLFVCLDSVMLLQYMFYTHRNRRLSRSQEGVELQASLFPANAPASAFPESKPALGRPHTVLAVAGAFFILGGGSRAFCLSHSSSSASQRASGGRVLLQDPAGSEPLGNPCVSAAAAGLPTLVGTGLGWVSSACYLASRVPQVWRNHVRRNVDGLSPVMFGCAVAGNCTYGVAVLLRLPDVAALWPKLPYLLGSLGTLCFDAIILTQLRVYRTNSDSDSDGDGNSSGERDNGRGGCSSGNDDSSSSQEQHAISRKSRTYQLGLGSIDLGIARRLFRKGRDAYVVHSSHHDRDSTSEFDYENLT